jgi:cytidine deaminase
VSQGHHDFVKLAVSCDADHCQPCGACRQVIYEHAPNIVILMGNLKGDFKRTTIKELLPEAFSL